VPSLGVSQWSNAVAKTIGGNMAMGAEFCDTHKSQADPKADSLEAVCLSAPSCLKAILSMLCEIPSFIHQAWGL